VPGTYTDRTATIHFDPATTDVVKGSVDTLVDIGSLSLGNVTQQALGPEFLDVARFSTARVQAQILKRDDGYELEGTLTIRDISVPLTLPFSLEVNGPEAHASGRVSLDRRAFGIGAAYADESSLAFAVSVSIDLSAVRDPDF
jgi:polyisoprenoid-binding protein YceI